MPQPAIQLNSISMAYPDGNEVLSDLSLTIPAGQFVSIVGPSGCGKSTLLRIIAGLERPTAGEIQPESADNVSFVFQDPTLLPWRSVSGNIGLPLELRREPRHEVRPRVVQAMQAVSLQESDLEKLPHMLSGGMRMRVSIARALITAPELMLLDEPFAAIDDILRQQLNEELLSVWRDANFTALFVTHNISEAVFLSQRVLVMNRGGEISADVAIPFPYPREAALRGEPEFSQTYRIIFDHLARAS